MAATRRMQRNHSQSLTKLKETLPSTYISKTALTTPKIGEEPLDEPDLIEVSFISNNSDHASPLMSLAKKTTIRTKCKVTLGKMDDTIDRTKSFVSIQKEAFKIKEVSEEDSSGSQRSCFSGKSKRNNTKGNYHLRHSEGIVKGN